MTDHAWTPEHVAAYLAGGLTTDEAARLEAHAIACPECAAALSAARRLDAELSSLFAPVRPAPGLEDRMIHALRTTRQKTLLVTGRVGRAMTAAAALLVLGTIGGVAASVSHDGRLPLPGTFARATVAQGNKSAGSTEPEVHVSDLRNEDFGVESTVAAALQDMKKWDEKPAGGIANTNSNKVVEFALPDYASFDRPLRQNADGTASGRTSNLPALNGTTHGRSSVVDSWHFKEYGGHLPQVTFSDSTAKPTLGDADGSRFLFRPSEFKWAVTATNGAAQPDPKKPDAPPPPKVPPAASTPAPKTDPKPAAPEPEAAQRVVIRSGEVDYEVESFDAALATVTKLVSGLKGAFVATVNSEKLPNGKVKGTVIVRTPPELLDSLLLDLRRELGKGGELKGSRIGSRDVTKQYVDLESRLKAAHTMEQRLLQIIKEGKGEIKTLLEAERELGVWRTKIEEAEGELRYYANLVALSTLMIAVTEKDIRTAAGVTEAERVQAGIEVEDVDKAFQQVLAAVAAAIGRVTKSELKQLAAGQFNATLHFETAPDAAGPLRDRLSQLGRVARLEIDRVQQAEGGTVPKDAKPKRGDTVFLVQLYNLANVAARETSTLQIAVADVPAAYQALRDTVVKAGGRVVTAQLNEQDRQNVTAQLDFEIKRAEEATSRAALDAAGEVAGRQVARAAEGENVTDTKVFYRVTLLAAGRLKPREVTTLAVEVADVEQAATVFGARVAEAKGRQVDAQSARERSGRVTAKVVYVVPLAAVAGLVEQFKAAGTVRVHQSTRDPQAPDGKFAIARVEVALSSGEGIVGEDDGLWPQVRRGLAYSASVLLTSVTWVVFGLCVVLPWALVGYGGYKLVRRIVRRTRPPGGTPQA